MRLIVAVVLVTLPRVICVQPTNCHRFCADGTPHTECYPKGGGIACANNEKVYLSSYEKKYILDYHNDKRSLLAAGEIKGLGKCSNMMKLVWEGELGLYAKRWADQCLEGPHDQCRTTEDGTATGQNSYLGVYKNTGSIGDIKIRERFARILMMLEAWFNEISLVNATDIKSYDANRSLTTGNATQMIWAETIYIACGYTEFSLEENFLMFRFICDYKRSGNINAEAVYLEGPPCSTCPEETHCSESIPTLCYNGDTNDFIDGSKAHLNKPVFFHVISLFTFVTLIRIFRCAVDE